MERLLVGRLKRTMNELRKTIGDDFEVSIKYLWGQQQCQQESRVREKAVYMSIQTAGGG